MDNRNLFRNVALGGIVAAALFAASPGFAALPKCGPADMPGSAMPAGSTTDRTVTVTPKTRSINVKYGETVKFVVQDGAASHEVAWKFDGVANKILLSDIDPKTSLKSVPVYVNQSANPLSSCD